MELISKIFNIVQLARDHEVALIDSLNEEERAATGTLKRWSFKDQVAHIAWWKQRNSQTFAAAASGQMPPEPIEYLEANDQAFEEYRDKSWDEVLAFSQSAHEAFVRTAKALSNEDLTDPERFPWQEGRPLWRNIVGTGFIHPTHHLASMYTALGQGELAAKIQEDGGTRLLELDDSDDWRGLTLYNLACAYALSGKKDKAVANLAESLQLRPDLMEWSKEDPDFSSIRDEPGYLALYSD
jgi:tetratricopeptide (TPR) repeat protein